MKATINHMVKWLVDVRTAARQTIHVWLGSHRRGIPRKTSADMAIVKQVCWPAGGNISACLGKVWPHLPRVPK